jgi:hypothetical protein
MTRIANHFAITEDSNYNLLREHALSIPNPTERTEALSRISDWSRYTPVSMHANDLPVPSLNVMYGSTAIEGASNYMKDKTDRVLVKMTLGDIRSIGGGEVYFDTGAALDDRNSTPLIITAPGNVPVDIIHP